MTASSKGLLMSGFKPDWVSPPGHTIQSILATRKTSVVDFAEQIGLSLHEVQLLFIGKYKIDQPLAAKLAATLGSTERFWLARETKYRSECKRLGKDH